MGAAVDKEGMNQANIRDLSNRLVQEVETVVVGKRAAVEMAVISLLCEGHLLIEVPCLTNPENWGNGYFTFEHINIFSKIIYIKTMIQSVHVPFKSKLTSILQ